ncbi:MAG: glycosyltransferase [Tangfeifania sp.]
MLTINIPVYNIDARPLVLQLTKQMQKLKTDVEIRVYDDGSEEAVKKINRKVQSVPGVIYTELEKNLGRSAIRNKMAEDSKFEYLLFIDADSKIVSEHYLQIYLKNLQNQRILCGGTIYSSTPPKDPTKLLRWVYGSKREAVSATQRNRNKGFIITSNNFCIEKKLFLKSRFRENIGHYGHEDTLLGFDLYKKGALPFHIENPVEHTGLENSETFLAKTRTALGSLHFISENIVKNESEFFRQVNFLNRYKKLTSLIPEMLLRQFFALFSIKMEENLTGKKPRLFWFDLYKLCYYATIKNRRP